MGRPEQPIAGDAPFEELALVLREIRSGAELTLEALAARIGCSPSALSKAAAGISLPGERLLRAWARECGQSGRAEELCEWRRKYKQEPRRKSSSTGKPGRPRKEDAGIVVRSRANPRMLQTPEQVMDALRALREMPPLRTYSALAHVMGWSKSTVHDALQRETLPSYELYMNFLRAFRVTDYEEWRAAYSRAEREQDRRRHELREQDRHRRALLAEENGENREPLEALVAAQDTPGPSAQKGGRTKRKFFARWRRTREPDGT